MSLPLYVIPIHSLSRVFLCSALAAALSFAGCRPSDGLSMEEASDQFPSTAFGAAAWREYFGVEVDEEPQLPANIERILHSMAPFLLDEESAPQRVGDNHLLTLIPSKVDEESFTLDKLGELVLQNRNGHFTAFQGNNKEVLGDCSRGYGYYSHYLTAVNRRTPLTRAPYWVLLPKTILQGSRGKHYAYQKAALEKYSGRGYELPRALEVATSLLAHYARSGGERLYASESHSKGWWTYTHCLDIDKDGDPLVVGGFEASGLGVSSSAMTTSVATSRPAGSFGPSGLSPLVRLGIHR